MTPDTTVRGEPAAAEYTAPKSRDVLLTEAITTTITGQPLPESVRPPAPTAPARRPATSSDWLLEILRGPAK